MDIQKDAVPGQTKYLIKTDSVHLFENIVGTFWSSFKYLETAKNMATSLPNIIYFYNK
jgi:hypothetical protein